MRAHLEEYIGIFLRLTLHFTIYAHKSALDLNSNVTFVFAFRVNIRLFPI